MSVWIEDGNDFIGNEKNIPGCLLQMSSQYPEGGGKLVSCSECLLQSEGESPTVSPGYEYGYWHVFFLPLKEWTEQVSLCPTQKLLLPETREYQSFL